MKNSRIVFTLLLLFVNIVLFANKKYDVFVDERNFTIVDSLSVSTDVAYNNVQSWIINSSESYKASVQFESKEQGKIIAKLGIAFPNINNVSNLESFIIFDLTVEVKEGKYRIKLENIKGRNYYHSVELAYSTTDEEIKDIDIITFSCYKKDAVTGAYCFWYEERYEENRLRIQELKEKKLNSNKKELIKIENEITNIENHQRDIDRERETYILVNSAINKYVEALSRQINVKDDF